MEVCLSLPDVQTTLGDTLFWTQLRELACLHVASCSEMQKRDNLLENYSPLVPPFAPFPLRLAIQSYQTCYVPACDASSYTESNFFFSL